MSDKKASSQQPPSPPIQVEQQGENILDDASVVLRRLAEAHPVGMEQFQDATNLLIGHGLSYRDISNILGTLVRTKQGVDGRGVEVDESTLGELMPGEIFLYYFNRHYKVPGFGYYVVPGPPQLQEQRQQQRQPVLVQIPTRLPVSPGFRLGDFAYSLPIASASTTPEATAMPSGSGRPLSPNKTDNNNNNKKKKKKNKKCNKKCRKSKPMSIADREAVGPAFVVRMHGPDGRPKESGKEWLKAVEGEDGDDNEDNSVKDNEETEKEDSKDDEETEGAVKRETTETKIDKTKEVGAEWEWVPPRHGLFTRR